MNKRLKNILITLFLVPLVCGGIYLWVVNDAPYRHALNFTKGDKEITGVIGKVETARLSFSGRSSVTFNDKHGHADYTINVKGEKGKGVLSLELKKDQGTWRVVHGDLVCADGRNISLRGEN